MRIPNTYFTKTNGNLAPLPVSQDPISGLLFYNDLIPPLWSDNSTGDCNWATAKAYVIGDIVYESVNKRFYICLVNHTSGVFATDLTAAKWELKAGENIKLVRRVLDIQALGIIKGSTDFSLEYYQASEFFRVNSNGYLYLSIYPVPTSPYTFSELYDFQNELNGDLRQVAIHTDIAFDTVEVQALQLIATQLEDEYMPLSVLYSADFTGIYDLNNLDSLRNLQSPKISVISGMDGSADGYALYVSTGKSVCAIGATLGAVSKVLVNESVASPELINFASAELDLPLFGNGQRIKDLSVSLIEDIYDKGYLFFKKFKGEVGTYIIDTLTCTDELNDYLDIQRNRTMDKVLRQLRKALLPKLHSKVQLSDTGKMSPLALSIFNDVTSAPLAQMKADTEISNYKIYIDPAQDVLRTSTLYVQISILPYATARWIDTTVGFTASI